MHKQGRMSGGCRRVLLTMAAVVCGWCWCHSLAQAQQAGNSPGANRAMHIEITQTSPEATRTEPLLTFSKPLPVQLLGRIVNYQEVPEELRNGMHLYILQKSQQDQVYAIQPECSVSSDGTFGASVWLGNDLMGSNQIFELVFVMKRTPYVLQGNINTTRMLPSGDDLYWHQVLMVSRLD
ncbi:MAG: hypothetical protein ACP59X_19835 [Solidesulfovibrio sp. DCME]|uniref:hypothetical protein n=1 Tax=Solidesulfovibrio sp. DCME TaxID=3447380 RepID=UPI003D0B0AE3